MSSYGFGHSKRKRSQWYIQWPRDGKHTYEVRKATLKADGTRDWRSTQDEVVSKHRTSKDASAALAKLETDQMKTEAAERQTKGREKTIFPSAEIPHLWMHKVQHSAYNAKRSLYFEGDTIYSYGSHFPIAVHVTNDKGKAGVLLNSGSYSVTTSGHQNMVRSAIPDTVPVFEIPGMGLSYGTTAHLSTATHNDNLKYFQNQIDKRAATAARARLPFSRDWNLQEALEIGAMATGEHGSSASGGSGGHRFGGCWAGGALIAPPRTFTP